MRPAVAGRIKKFWFITDRRNELSRHGIGRDGIILSLPPSK